MSLPRKLSQLFSEAEIAARVNALATEIASGRLRPDIALPILAGSFVFAADLLRDLAKQGLVLPIEFIWLRSYAASRRGGEISVLVGPPEDLHGKTVLLIDGVLDRGHTLAKARELLLEQEAATVLTAVVVDKGHPLAAFRADYAAFSGVADFIVGYGMDDAGFGRGLPYIAKVE